MDFGIAGGKVLSRLTVTGARVGTPVYMSPEQARGVRIDHRSDIYSLGLVFYEMLTGDTAFKGGYEAIVHQQIFQTPPPPRQVNLKINRKLDELIMTMLSKEPDERPPLAEIRAFLETRRFREEPRTDLPSRIIITVGSKQGVVRILDTDGMLHASVGDIGVGAGTFSAAPIALTVDSEGSLYAALFEYRTGDHGEHRMIQKLSPEGELLTAFGRYGMKPGEFLYPASLTMAPDGSLFILDSETHLVQHFDSAGNYLNSFGGKGAGKGRFDEPRMIKAGHDGAVYVLDYGNRQVQRLSSSGTYETHWAFRHGGEMRVLDGVTVDQTGNLYISDATGGKIHQITPDARVAQSFSYEARKGETGDALLDLGVDLDGNLYAGRRGGHLIRKFSPEGELLDTIETYAPLVQMLVDICSVTQAGADAAALQGAAAEPAEVTGPGSAGLR
jgi:serine/threonine-protein kinase